MGVPDMQAHDITHQESFGSSSAAVVSAFAWCCHNLLSVDDEDGVPPPDALRAHGVGDAVARLSVSRSPKCFGEMRALLKQAARGAHTAEAITALEDLRDGVPDDYMKRFTSRAREAHILRFQIEQGNLEEATKALNEYKEVPTTGIDGPSSCVAEGDLYFSLGRYEKAISIYQDHIALGMTRSTQNGNPFMDDILFSKIGLAHLKSGDMHSARKNFFQCAAELQETHGFYLESIVSAARIDMLCGGEQDEGRYILPTDFSSTARLQRAFFLETKPSPARAPWKRPSMVMFTVITSKRVRYSARRILEVLTCKKPRFCGQRTLESDTCRSWPTSVMMTLTKSSSKILSLR